MNIQSEEGKQKCDPGRAPKFVTFSLNVCVNVVLFDLLC